MNLVANAVKFTPAGEVTVRFSPLEVSDSNLRLRCEVTDSGIGISPKAAESLFLPFSQSDESTSRKYGGSGLGLAISKQIVDAQSGTIGVLSNLHKGSTFWFEVPFEVAAKETEDHSTELEPAPIRRPGERILLAEDNEVSRLVAVKQLEALGREVDVANNGHEVLEALRQRSYSLVLMDCQMPELDGYQATRLIRNQGYSKSDLPIIALTSYVFEEDRERCLEAGMNDFLSKPLSLERLSATLVKWLEADAVIE